MTPGFIPPHGGYSNLLSFEKARVVFQQLRQLERAFLQEGGLRERMTQARLAERARQHHRPSD